MEIQRISENDIALSARVPATPLTKKWRFSLKKKTTVTLQRWSSSVVLWKKWRRQAGLANMSSALCNVIKSHLVTCRRPLKTLTACGRLCDLTVRCWECDSAGRTEIFHACMLENVPEKPCLWSGRPSRGVIPQVLHLTGSGVKDRMNLILEVKNLKDVNAEVWTLLSI